jgi:hypothetical protein
LIIASCEDAQVAQTVCALEQDTLSKAEKAEAKNAGRGGIEPPTRGFSVTNGIRNINCINRLAGAPVATMPHEDRAGLIRKTPEGPAVSKTPEPAAATQARTRSQSPPRYPREPITAAKTEDPHCRTPGLAKGVARKQQGMSDTQRQAAPTTLPVYGS